MDIQVVKMLPKEKSKTEVCFDNGEKVPLYHGEIRKLSLHEGAYISSETYEQILWEIVGLRAKKRAMHLLERMDRTESQLRQKLEQNGYPAVCVEAAIEYVKSYHYIDDARYAENYIRYGQEKKSRQRLQMDLYAKGVDREVVAQAMEEVFCADEQQKIMTLLEKKHYDPEQSDRKEQQRIYQFLMRRGYRSSDISHAMRFWAEREA